MSALQNKVLAFLLLILTIPIWLILYILIKTTSKGSFIWKQKRLSKDKKIFTIFKIRTMVNEAENLKKSLISFNEADGPVFKIRNDPRYTKIGKFLSHIGIDELPQLINVLKGEMNLVGPRPLPVREALKIPVKYKSRFDIMPGITSSWVIKGAHKLSFDDWMKLDLEYVKNSSFSLDLKVLAQTAILILKMISTKLNQL